MRALIIGVALLVSSAALATGPTKYPPGTPAAAIAKDQAVKMSIAGKPGVQYCYLIDTRTGACRALLVLDAGGDGSGGASAGAAAK